jgi:hypothetical protein
VSPQKNIFICDQFIFLGRDGGGSALAKKKKGGKKKKKKGN